MTRTPKVEDEDDNEYEDDSQPLNCKRQTANRQLQTHTILLYE